MKWHFWIAAASVAIVLTSSASGASLTVPIRRYDDRKALEVEIALTKRTPGSHGCCEQTLKRTARFEPGVSRVEVIFQDLEACSYPIGHCAYQVTWRGPTTLFGSTEPAIREEGAVQLADVVVEEGKVLSGAVSMEKDRPYQRAFVTLFHPSLPDGEVRVPIAQDGTFQFVGIPATGQVRWQFESLHSELMKLAGVLDGEAKLLIILRTAQHITGCLTRRGEPVAGASVQLFYEAWPGGSIEVGSAGSGADGCFDILRDREAPAELRIYFGPSGRHRMPLPDIAAGQPTPPLSLGVIALSDQ